MGESRTADEEHAMNFYLMRFVTCESLQTHHHFVIVIIHSEMAFKPKCKYELIEYDARAPTHTRTPTTKMLCALGLCVCVLREQNTWKRYARTRGSTTPMRSSAGAIIERNKNIYQCNRVASFSVCPWCCSAEKQNRFRVWTIFMPNKNVSLIE